MKRFISIVILSFLYNCNMKPENPVNRNERLTLPRDTAHLQAVSTHARAMYTVFVSRKLDETKMFYTKWFGFKVVFESTWFLLLQLPGSANTTLAFMTEDHPSSPPSPKVFEDGSFVTIEVADSKTVYDAFKKAGAVFAYTLKDEPWGQKRFAITDPNGLWIDVVQQTTPDEGWWDQYLNSTD
jgi:catechol 2,3-dioxygenase-like lactoylglutathione lyase family enzyme